MNKDMLIKDFYTIIEWTEIAEDTRTVTIRLNADHPLYQGHFPGQSVVPGVCWLQLIRECLEKTVNKNLRYAAISSCKFLNAVNPEEADLIQLKIRFHETEENGYNLQVEGTEKNTGFIKVKASLKAQ